MPSNLTPTVVKQTQFTTEEISRRADPDWIRDRNYLRAYEFGPGGKRKFIDHRDNVYQEDEEPEPDVLPPDGFAFLGSYDGSGMSSYDGSPMLVRDV